MSFDFNTSKNSLDAQNATFTQNFAVIASNTDSNLEVHVNVLFNGLHHPLLEVSFDDLLNNHLEFIEVGDIGCITEDFKSIANQLRQLAENIESRTANINAAAFKKCCSFCDNF